jgi:sterol desaturase/sphingolipid hydroxylase (fatty acid hydroxylase superfamily)
METEVYRVNWIENYWLCWGVGPFVAATSAFIIAVVVFESIVRSEIFLFTHFSDNHKKSRQDLIRSVHEKVNFKRQLFDSMSLILGPIAWLNFVVLALTLHYFIPEVNTFYPTLNEFIIHFIILLLIADFFLYWGHRIQHTNKWLWDNLHTYHHRITTPTPISTLCINSWDATLQGGMPFIIAAAIIKPKPLTLYIFIFLRICENVINHSGLNSTVINIITLRILPLRAPISHHDSHHKYSNFQNSHGKNFGESFIIWDWMFNTLRH